MGKTSQLQKKTDRIWNQDLHVVRWQCKKIHFPSLDPFYDNVRFSCSFCDINYDSVCINPPTHHSTTAPITIHTHDIIVALFLADDHALVITRHILAGREEILTKVTCVLPLTRRRTLTKLQLSVRMTTPGLLPSAVFWWEKFVWRVLYSNISWISTVKHTSAQQLLTLLLERKWKVAG